MDLLLSQSNEAFLPAFNLYLTLHGTGIQCMWLESFNSKAGLITGDKHTYLTSVDVMNYKLNINIHGPTLDTYDIRIPCLKMAFSSKSHSVNLNKAKKSS